jgi:hypothetical protein
LKKNINKIEKTSLQKHFQAYRSSGPPGEQEEDGDEVEQELDEDEVDENKAHKRSPLTSKKDKIGSTKHTKEAHEEDNNTKGRKPQTVHH